jgi:hypothetical protein
MSKTLIENVTCQIGLFISFLTRFLLIQRGFHHFILLYKQRMGSLRNGFFSQINSTQDIELKV